MIIKDFERTIMECFLCHKEKELVEHADKCNICEPCRLIIDEQHLMPVGMQDGKLLVSEKAYMKQVAMGSSHDLLKHITEFATRKFVGHQKKNNRNREQPWRIKERERREKGTK